MAIKVNPNKLLYIHFSTTDIIYVLNLKVYIKCLDKVNI